jgi:hypothetical protein
MSDLVRSVIRSVTPIVVGFGVALLARLGIKSPDQLAAVGAVVSALYAWIVRWVERKHPKVGVLLGVKGAPTYQ